MKKYIIVATIIFAVAGSMLFAMNKKYRVKIPRLVKKYYFIAKVFYQRSPWIFEDQKIRVKVPCEADFSCSVSKLKKMFADHAGKLAYMATLDPERITLKFNDQLLQDDQTFYCEADALQKNNEERVCTGIFTVKSIPQTMFDTNF